MVRDVKKVGVVGYGWGGAKKLAFAGEAWVALAALTYNLGQH